MGSNIQSQYEEIHQQLGKEVALPCLGICNNNNKNHRNNFQPSQAFCVFQIWSWLRNLDSRKTHLDIGVEEENPRLERARRGLFPGMWLWSFLAAGEKKNHTSFLPVPYSVQGENQKHQTTVRGSLLPRCRRQLAESTVFEYRLRRCSTDELLVINSLHKHCIYK